MNCQKDFLWNPTAASGTNAIVQMWCACDKCKKRSLRLRVVDALDEFHHRLPTVFHRLPFSWFFGSLCWYRERTFGGPSDSGSAFLSCCKIVDAK